MTPVLVLKLVHVLTAIWFISGLLGRWVALDQAGRATDVRTAFELSELAGRFERPSRRSPPILILLFGLITAWIAGQPVLGFIKEPTPTGSWFRSSSTSARSRLCP